MNPPQMGSPAPESTPSLKLHSAGELMGASADASTTRHENGENTSVPPRNGRDDDFDAPHVASMDDEPSPAVQDPVKGAVPVKRKHAELDPEGKTQQGSDENTDEEGKQKKRKTEKVVLQAFVSSLEGQGIPISPTSSGPNQTRTASVGESTCLTNPPVVSNDGNSKSGEATSSRPAIYIRSQSVAEKPPQTIGTREDVLQVPVQTPPTSSNAAPLAVQTLAVNTATKSELPQQTSAAHPSSGPPSRPPSSAPTWPPSHPTSRPPSRAPSSDPSANTHQLPPKPQTTSSASFSASHCVLFAPPHPSDPIPMGTVIPGPENSRMSGGTQGPLNPNSVIMRVQPQHPQQVNGPPPPNLNQQQAMMTPHQAPPNTLPPGTNAQHPQHMPPPGQPTSMVMTAMTANGPSVLPHPSVFHNVGVQLSPMSLANNPPGVKIPLTQTKAAAQEERRIAQANHAAGAVAAPTSVQRPPHLLQNAPSTPVAPNQARMSAQANKPAGAPASAPLTLQHFPHSLQNAPSPPVAPNQSRMGQTGAAASAPPVVQHPLQTPQSAPSTPTTPNQAQNNAVPTRQSRTIETAADMLVQLIRDAVAAAMTGAAAEKAQKAQENARWVTLLGKKEREIEAERAERRKEVEEQRAQWQKELRAREEDSVRSSRQIEQAEWALLQKETEFGKERAQCKEERDTWERERARNSEQAGRDKKEISQLSERVTSFEEERAQWDKIREALESENSQQIDQLSQQISLLMEKEMTFEGERAEWEKERDAWKGETARVSKERAQWEEERDTWEKERARNLEQAVRDKKEISQLSERVTNFEEERAQWEKVREALESDKVVNSQQIDQLNQQVSLLTEKETKFQEERAEWEKERDAWKGETARVKKLFELAEEQITQCIEKEKKFADERAQWGEGREALEADKARKSEEISQLQKNVKALGEELRRSQVAAQTEAQKGAEQSQQRQGPLSSTSIIGAARRAQAEGQGGMILMRQLSERISSQEAFIARIKADSTEQVQALQQSVKRLNEQNIALTANAQRSSQVIVTFLKKSQEFQTISKAVNSGNAPNSLLATKGEEFRVAGLELQQLVARPAAKDTAPRQGVPGGVGAQKPQPPGPNVPAKATEK